MRIIIQGLYDFPALFHGEVFDIINWLHLRPYITEYWSPWNIRPFWSNLLTFVFFTVLTCLGQSKPVLDHFSLTRAMYPYAQLPVAPAGCRVMSKCLKAHYTSLHTTTHHPPKKKDVDCSSGIPSLRSWSQLQKALRKRATA